MYKVVGTSLPIHDAKGKVTGDVKYTGDIRIPNMAHGKLVLSTIPHGKVVDVDASEALALEGVLGILTYKDFKDVKYNSALRFKDHEIKKTERPLSDIVRFVGDRVALVVAEDLKTAEKAAKLVKVTYEPYEAVFDEEDAMAEGAPVLHPEEAPGNKVAEINAGADLGEVTAAIDGADHIFEDKFKIPMVSQAPIETHTVIADYSMEKKVTLYSSTQNTFALRVLISDVFDLPYSKIRVIQPTLGGSFGSKLEAVTELAAVGAAIKFRRPVKVVLSRKENMVASRTRNGATIWVRSGVNNDRSIQGIDFSIATNTGGYVGSAVNVIGAMSHKVLKCYHVPVHYKGIPVVTNLPIAGAMRGYGSPQAFYGLQIHLNRAAEKLGLDPVAFLEQNVYTPDEVDPVGFGNPQLKKCIEVGKELFKWDERKERLAKEGNEGPIKRGIGIGIGAHGSGTFGAHQDCVNLTLRLNEDGSFNYWSASHDMGNGSLTAQTMIMAEVLGVNPRSIEPTRVDTETCPWNLGDYASRGIFVEGHGAYKAAMAVREDILEVAERAYEEADLDIEDGNIVKDGKVLGSLSDVSVYAQRKEQREIIKTISHHSEAGRTSYGAHLTEVEVNTDTGVVKMIDYVGIHDVGRVINRMGIEGQLEGGIHMGIGYALREGLTFDENGNLKQSDLKKYRILKAHEMPNMIMEFVEEGDTGGPFGAKSISECAVAPVAPTVINAVENAVGKDLTSFPIDEDELKR